MTFPLLDKIKDPKDLALLNLEQLESLAEEIRKKILNVLALNGGHLSSNLGIVELTIALHKVFSSPKDKFIFDTSHQTYTHKLLTGRAQRFDTLRQFKGLSGFANPEESKHDHFFAGHAGVTLSLALGLAKSRDLDAQNFKESKDSSINQNEEHIIPVLGDGSLTNGLVFEALNNLPKELKRFLVILNDNGMAISQNVGHIKNILSRFINHPMANKFYFKIQNLLAKIPAYGDTLADQGKKITESIKNLVSPASFFEHFGLSYVGPIDGHDLKKLIETFESLKELDRPMIVHILTQKGKGLHLAKENPMAYHGIKPFALTKTKSPAENDATIAAKKTIESVTFPQVFGSHLYSLVKKDNRIMVLSPAMLSGSYLNRIVNEFPDRCQDVGIAEGHCLTYASGLAQSKKLKVVAVIYSTFLQRALDNLFHDICLQKLPIVIAIDRAGLSGPDGVTHHGLYDLGFLNAMPNLVIAQPRNGQLLKELLESSFTYQRPVAIRYPNLPTTLSSETENQPVLETENKTISKAENKLLKKRECGEGEVLSEGKELLIIALGQMCETALEVKKLLLEEGINATVVDPVFLKPLDFDLFVTLLSKHQMVATIEEHAVSCGLGAIINNFIMKQGFSHLQVVNFGIPDTFVQHGKRQELLKELGLDPKNIAQRILKQIRNLVSVC